MVDAGAMVGETNMFDEESEDEEVDVIGGETAGASSAGVDDAAKSGKSVLWTISGNTWSSVNG